MAIRMIQNRGQRKTDTENIKGLNVATTKLTTVQMPTKADDVGWSLQRSDVCVVPINVQGSKH